MSAFRTRLVSVLGSVVSVTACGAKVEHSDDAKQPFASASNNTTDAGNTIGATNTADAANTIGASDKSTDVRKTTDAANTTSGEATSAHVESDAGDVPTLAPIDPSVGESLRHDLDGTDLCSRDENNSLQFSRVDGLAPAENQDYIEWRSIIYQYNEQGLTPETWEETKRTILENSSLSDAERQAQLEQQFTKYVLVQESNGECTLAAGCDRFIVGSTESLQSSPYLYYGSDQLLAVGASGTTTVTNEQELRTFLGAIDTPHEAALIAIIAGYRIDCEESAYTRAADGFLLYAKRGSACGQGDDIVGYRLRIDADGTIEALDSRVLERAEPNCTIGRFPSGKVAKRSCGHDEHPVGRYFADVARLEAASIIAFRELARDLAYHSAPQELVAWAQRAALEETEHALSCRALARRYGANLGPAHVNSSDVRSLLDIALDNAREGLTREAFGALVAHHQLHAAVDPAVRATLERIARDETSHAEFSIALHRWLQTRLDAAERASVEAALLEARSEMSSSLHPSYAPEVIALAGLPTPEVSRALFEQLFAEDWAA